jgi:hypothetical protein
MSWRNKVLLTITLLVLLTVAVSPAFQGYHVGFNALTDNSSLTRLGIQWGKYEPTCSGVGQGQPC